MPDRRIRQLSLVTAAALLTAACGSSDSPTTSAPETSASAPAAEAPDGIDPAVDVAFEPGGVAVGQVDIGGTVIDYVTATPAGFEPGDTAPVVFALPPGGQDLEVTQRLVEGTYAPEAIARGWVVVSPAAPEGVLYFRGSEAAVPGLVDWMESWVTPEGGAPHLVGVSNGGISAFRAAGSNPGRFRSVLVFPGFPQSAEDQDALDDIATVPFRMFVGENDTSWVGPMQDTAATLTELGADVELEIVPDEGHIISTLRDGVLLFNTLEVL